MKYGNLNSGRPDVSEELLALKDNLSKGIITKESYNIELSKLQQFVLKHIVDTNGGFIPGPRLQKKFNKLYSTLREMTSKEKAQKQIEDRNSFIDEVVSST